MAMIKRAVRGIKTVLRDIDRGFATMYTRQPSGAGVASRVARKTR